MKKEEAAVASSKKMKMDDALLSSEVMRRMKAESRRKIRDAPLTHAQVVAVVAESTGLPFHKVVGVFDALVNLARHELKRIGHFRLSGWFRLSVGKNNLVKNKFKKNNGVRRRHDRYWDDYGA